MCYVGLDFMISSKFDISKRDLLFANIAEKILDLLI